MRQNPIHRLPEWFDITVVYDTAAGEIYFHDARSWPSWPFPVPSWLGVLLDRDCRNKG